VRDLYPPEIGPQVFARVLSLLALAPLSAPILGALVFFFGGWRGCFVFLSLVGACGMVWMGWRFKESNATPNPRATHLPTLLRANAQCLRHPQFIAYTLTITGSYSMIFCVLSASPFVFIEHLNMSALAFGIMFGVVTAGFLLGTFVMRRIARFRSTARTAQIGALFSLSGGLLMLGLHQSASPWIVVLPIFIALIGHGILQPTCMMGAAAPFPQHAGTAVALMGFIMHVVAAPVGLAVTTAFDGSAWPMALGIAACTVLTAVCAWGLVRRLPAEPTVKPVLSRATP
jgi:DHA1 family bicyclomycin/chloramphenicol resistance-like MFS transporter